MRERCRCGHKRTEHGRVQGICVLCSCREFDPTLEGTKVRTYAGRPNLSNAKVSQDLNVTPEGKP